MTKFKKMVANKDFLRTRLLKFSFQTSSRDRYCLGIYKRPVVNNGINYWLVSRFSESTVLSVSFPIGSTGVLYTSMYLHGWLFFILKLVGKITASQRTPLPEIWPYRGLINPLVSLKKGRKPFFLGGAPVRRGGPRVHQPLGFPGAATPSSSDAS